MRRLPSVLTTDDLPLAELSALRQDGVVTAVGPWFAPLDVPCGADVRASAVAHGLPERMIAERGTAAWIWGASTETPTPHQFCTDLGARVTHRLVSWIELREVVLAPADTQLVGGILVTTPLRTIVDLARFAAGWSIHDDDTVRELQRIGSVPRSSIAEELARVNLPHKRRAQNRLGVSPS